METFDKLPPELTSHIISLTSPLSACRLSAVSSAFRSLADSDAVWLSFLPTSDDFRCTSGSFPCCSSKKEVFLTLAERHVLVDGGRMSFGVDRVTGKRCYIISPRAMSIVWGDTPQYWRWISLPDSRFSEVAELINVYWLEIRGKIQRNLLSRKTTYASYLIFKVNGNGLSFSFQPQETRVSTTRHTDIRTVSLAPDREFARRNSLMFHRNSHWPGIFNESEDFSEDFDEGDEIGYPRLRKDGWMEIELGEFYNDDENENGEVEMSFTEVKGHHCKRGLIVNGIEIRPKY